MIGALLALWTSQALAQTPITIEPKGQTMWASEEVATQRFPDDTEVAGPTLRVDAQVQVVLTDGDRVRVKSGDKYGWVALAKLTTEPPAMPALPEGLDLSQLTAPMDGRPPSLGSGFRGDAGASPK
ncbi:MAG: hypothetical protein KTR31_00835 [Myxococcales bacterium]|nr:hypothetical protein [Myxococcales bacterium]